MRLCNWRRHLLRGREDFCEVNRSLMGPGCQLMQLRRTVAMVAGDVMMANST